VTVTYYNDVEMPSCSNLFQCMVMINNSDGDVFESTSSAKFTMKYLSHLINIKYNNKHNNI